MRVSRKRKIAAALLIVMIIDEEMEEQKLKAKRRRRSCWVDDINLTRPTEGIFVKMNNELRLMPHKFKNLVRVSTEDFDFLVKLVEPFIKKPDSNFRKSVSPAERLAVTLNYLGSGSSMTQLSYLFRMSKTSISRIIPETCDALYNVLKDEYLKMPNTVEEWEKIAKNFEERWNFPNCCGVLDGKHVEIQPPVKRSSEFFNFNSIVLMAMADADYKFIYIDVCSSERDSDEDVFARTSLAKALSKNLLNFPSPKQLRDDDIPIPYVVLADDTFPLKPYLMKPFTFCDMKLRQRIYNYRVSRARVVLENSFGICAARFRILRRPIDLSPEKATKIVLAICALHNFITTRNPLKGGIVDREINGEIIPGSWRQHLDSVGVLSSIPRTKLGRCSETATEVRNRFMNYFMTNEGEVPGQLEKAQNL